MSNKLINNEMINEKEVEDALEVVINLSSALGITESELANVLNKGIKGWSGKYDLIKPNHTLLIK